MRLLLDTHIWLWGLLEPERIPAPLAAGLKRAQFQRWVSAVSVREAVMLIERGRISLPHFEALVGRLRSSGEIQFAALTVDIALEMARVPRELRDPADRLLLATARVEGMRLITADRRLQRFLPD